jgi:hypothetical protein
MRMADFNIKSKHDEEVEELARNLRRNKLASSESEARRMAEEMVNTSKKVHDDFAEREKKIYGGEKKSPEIELAHKQVEQLATNIAKGKSNVRIDIPELDVTRPLKDLVAEDEAYDKESDEDVGDEAEASEGEAKEEAWDEPEQEAEEVKTDEPAEQEPSEEHVDEDDDDNGDVGPGDEPAEPVQVNKSDDDADEGREEGGDDDKGDDSDSGGGNEPEPDVPVDAEKEAASDEGEGSDEEEEPDFTVKELDNNEQLRKSEEERKAELAKMPESRINLTNVFNVHK